LGYGTERYSFFVDKGADALFQRLRPPSNVFQPLAQLGELPARRYCKQLYRPVVERDGPRHYEKSRVGRELGDCPRAQLQLRHRPQKAGAMSLR